MTTATQQLPSNPAIDFANVVLAETDNAREIINMLHDIAQGNRESSTANDRIAASKVLLDRGLGKCPKHIFPGVAQSPDDDDNDVGAIHESPTPTSRSEPDSPRIVTRLDAALHDSVGPAPTAHNPLSLEGEGLGEGEMNTLDPNSIHFTIQQHILDITNNCRTLNTALTDICRAPEDDSKVTDYHRIRAGQMLLDRVLGTDPNAARRVVCPDCRRRRTTHPGSNTRTETYPKKKPGRRMSKVDPEALAEVHAELKRMEDAGILTPDPNAEEIDITPYLPPDDFDLSPYAKEEAAKFWANIELRYERQQQWPAIEERRRKKLEQIYPSHSEDNTNDPPEP